MWEWISAVFLSRSVTEFCCPLLENLGRVSRWRSSSIQTTTLRSSVKNILWWRRAVTWWSASANPTGANQRIKTKKCWFLHSWRSMFLFRTLENNTLVQRLENSAFSKSQTGSLPSLTGHWEIFLKLKQGIRKSWEMEKERNRES